MVEAEFEKGDPVLYTSNTGEIELGTVINVHYDDSPPYYTIRLTRNNKEKVTDGKNLTYLDSETDDNETTPNTSSASSKNIEDRSAQTVCDTSMVRSWPLWLATAFLSLGVVFVSYRLSKNTSSSLVPKRFI
jgi:hypothetical protein